jgi:hypothetical protein
VPPPTLDDHPGFFQRVEDFSVEQFITQLTSVTCFCWHGYASFFGSGAMVMVKSHR